MSDHEHGVRLILSGNECLARNEEWRRDFADR
jgi:hypothetical protein